MAWYKIHYSEQDVEVEASEEAEADFLARQEVEPDSIEEIDSPSEDY